MRVIHECLTYFSVSVIIFVTNKNNFITKTQIFYYGISRKKSASFQ